MTLFAHGRPSGRPAAAAARTGGRRALRRGLGLTGVVAMIGTAAAVVPASGALAAVAVATTTTVTSSVNPSVPGQAVTFTATVSKQFSTFYAPNGGTVTYSDGSTTIPGCGSVALTVGATTSTASCTVPGLSVGTNTIKAAYSGGGTNANGLGTPDTFAGSSGTLTQNVAKADITISGTTSSPNPSTYPQSVTYSTTIVPPAGAPAPTGSVTFKAIDANGVETTLGTDTTLSPTGVDDQVTASVSHAGLAPGSYTIGVTYSGDTNYNGRSSKTLTQVVNTASIGLASSSTPNPSTFGDTVTYSATVTPPAGGAAPTGSVTFKAIDANGVETTLGTDSTLTATGVGNQVTASVSHAGLPAGSYTIKVSYSGDTNYASRSSKALTQVVNKANQAITFPAIANHTYGDAPFAISASATSGLPVSFTSATPSVCTVSGSTDTATVTIVGAGTCTITASQAGGANYNAAPNVSRSFTVNKANQSITFPAIAGHTFGDSPFTISARSTSGLPITFTSNTPGVCTVSGSTHTTGKNYAATVTLVGAGDCSITASQPGNANFSPANPKTQVFHVTGADLAVAVTANPTSLQGNGPVTYTVTVTNNGPDAANNVTLGDLLPAVQTDPNTGYTTDAIFLSGATSQGNCSFPAANTRLTGQSANCSLGTIASGDSVTITLNLALASRSRAVSNHPYRFTDTATVSSATPDQNTANNSDSATVTYRIG